jgi:hypothetical protein
MELIVDTTTKELSVRAGDDLTRFSVRVLPRRDRDDGDAGLEAVADALRAHAAGTVDPQGDACIAPGVIRRLVHEAASAGGSGIDAGWDARFSSMLDEAASRGWVAEDGGVRAHVEWGS